MAHSSSASSLLLPLVGDGDDAGATAAGAGPDLAAKKLNSVVPGGADLLRLLELGPAGGDGE